jgi:hypothetical protein
LRVVRHPTPTEVRECLEQGVTATRKPAEPWDVEWAAELAGEALAYLARHYPECAGSDAIRVHEEVAHEVAMHADEDKCREALRAYCRAGRDEALQIRRDAA